MIPTFNKPTNYTQSWSYGCYTEPGGHDAHAHPRRALTGPSYIAQHNMTLDTCESFCVGSGCSLWGVEYGGECYCGNHLSHGSFPTFPDDCDLLCPGDAHEYCGGLNRLSLYGSEPYPPKVIASSHPAVYKHRFLGCWTEGEGSRALLGPRVTSARFMTVERCGNFCIDSGYTGFGLEYGSECYCGNELAKSSKICDAKECNMECSGKEGEVCGGRDTLSLYLWI
ncbi:WSC domain containing protein [Rhypophila decipiens]